MSGKNVNLELMEFIETNILPRYSSFDKAHGLSHINRVIDNSLSLANSLGADINMAYAIAAYHDLGLEGPRAIHHLTSGRILAADKRLCRWFSPEQLKIMREAVEDHRASSSHTPRSIYGKIVAEADRELSPDIVVRRTMEYGLDHYPEKSKEEHWQRFVAHLNNKYSTHGYIQLWLPNSPNKAKLKALRDLVNDQKRLREAFERMYDEVVGQQKQGT